MPNLKLICPTCRAVLQTAKPQRPGTVLNCPKCKNSFAVPAAPAAPPVIEAEEDEELVERRPRRKRFHRKERSGNGVLIGILVGVLILGVIGVTAIVVVAMYSKDDAVAKKNDTPAPTLPRRDNRFDPPFQPPQGQPPPKRDRKGDSFDPSKFDWSGLDVGDLQVQPATEMAGFKYVTANVDVVMGIDLRSLGTVSEFAALIDQIDRQIDDSSGSPFRLGDIDYIIAGLKSKELFQTGSNSEVLFIVQSKTVSSTLRILSAFGGTPTEANGKRYLKSRSKSGPAFGYQAQDRLIVFGDTVFLDGVLALDGRQPGLAAPVQAVLKDVGAAHFWAALPQTTLHDSLKEKILATEGLPEKLRPAVEGLCDAKAAGMGIRLRGKQAELSAMVHCADAKTSEQAIAILQKYWDDEVQSKLTGLKSAFPQYASIIADGQSLKLDHQSEKAKATATISFATLDTLIKLGQLQRKQK